MITHTATVEHHGLDPLVDAALAAREPMVFALAAFARASRGPASPCFRVEAEATVIPAISSMKLHVDVFARESDRPYADDPSCRTLSCGSATDGAASTVVSFAFSFRCAHGLGRGPKLLLDGLAFLTHDAFVAVTDALALVRFRRIEAADLRRPPCRPAACPVLRSSAWCSLPPSP